MSEPLRVVKLGGDALASPERIAAAARWAAGERRHGPLVLVASARRGVTDHLLGLVNAVEAALPATAASDHAVAAAERAVAAGETVSASLLALALARLGVPAVAADAREAGIAAEGSAGGARLASVAADPLRRLLTDGVTPVVLGFQGWQGGRVATLGRGGSDTTAVAVAVALGAARCELIKDAGGVFSADPRIAPAARLLPRVPLRFLVQLAAAGAKVVHVAAAELAERHGVPLRLASLGAARETTVGGTATTPLHAVAARSGGCPTHADSVAVTVVSHGAGRLRPLHHHLHRAVRLAGIPLLGLRCGGEQLTFRVADGDGGLLVRLLDHHLARADAGDLPAGRPLAPLATGELTGSCA